MKARMFLVLFLALGFVLFGPVRNFTQRHLGASNLPRQVATTPGEAQQRVLEAYGKLPLSFEANQGQTDPRVKFLAHGTGYSLFLTPSEAVLSLHGSRAVAQKDSGARALARKEKRSTEVVRLQLVGANPAPTVLGLAELPGKSNYLLGNDPQKWHVNVPSYARVKYQDVYPGIDLVYYGNQRQLEHDFIVAPGASPRDITLGIQAAGELRIDERGDAVLRTANGDLRLREPRVYQEVEGREQEIPARYALRGERQLGFEVAAYDAARPLVIDPVLTYSTFLGGSGDEIGFGIAVDSTGNAYVTGFTSSTDFPTTPGVVKTANASGFDAFVTKLNAAGSSRVYSTYLGGTGDDVGTAIAVDSGNNAYVTGITSSTDFPTSAGAFQAAFNGVEDAFVTKLNSTGTALAYSTYLGGSGDDGAFGIATDSAGNAYVTGFTDSTDFPTNATNAPFQSTFAGTFDAFMTKIDTTKLGNASLIYSTYLGGTGDDEGFAISVDSSGMAYLTGVAAANFPTSAGTFQTSFQGGLHDAFVAKFDATKSGAASRIYSTYLGGSGGDDEGFGIAVDSTGNAYVTGATSSITFPTVGAIQSALNGPSDAFVTKLNATASGLVYSTYLGGSADDAGLAIALDSSNNAHVTGNTFSANFPTTPSAFQTVFGGGNDAFVTKFNTAGSSLLYSTYLGGPGGDQGNGIAVDTSGAAYVTGNAGSGFPTTPGASQTTFGGVRDAFVAKIVPVVDFKLAANPTAATVKAGQPAIYALTITPSDGFSQAVALKCTGAPPQSNCAINPTSVTPNGVNPSNATVTLSTLAPGTPVPAQWGNLGMPPLGGRPGPGLASLLLLAAGGMLVSLTIIRRRRSWLLSGAAALVFLACLGCTRSSTSPGTPPGNYTLTVTGTSGAPPHITLLTVTVQ